MFEGDRTQKRKQQMNTQAARKSVAMEGRGRTKRKEVVRAGVFWVKEVRASGWLHW